MVMPVLMVHEANVTCLYKAVYSVVSLPINVGVVPSCLKPTCMSLHVCTHITDDRKLLSDIIL